tara:strand:- start:4643 stop:4891 length:249 start_codon:yes stop_codon:yes gene_type:complete
MKLKELSEKLIDELEIESITEIHLDTDIIQIEEWDSLNTLVLINFVKVNFDLDLTIDHIGDSLKLSQLISFIENNSKHIIEK